MGGLYNVVFNMDPRAPIVLEVLQLTPQDFGRFRDAWPENGRFRVYTRCGGGNRADYEATFEELRKHPLYLSDEDDSFDSTYASIFFSYPEQWKTQLQTIEEKAFVDTDERWKRALAALGAKS